MRKPVVTAGLLAASVVAVLLVWYAVHPGPPPPRVLRLPPQEAAAYAYLCDNAKDEGPYEECARWFVVTRGGRTWQLADAAEGAPVDLSADGRYLAYARAADQRIVVRDLVAGTVRPIQEAVNTDGLPGRELVPALLDNGRYLYVSVQATDSSGERSGVPPDFIVDVASGRTIWRLPRNGRLARLDHDGTRLMVASDKSFAVLDPSGTRTIPLPAELRAIEAAGELTPDGNGQAAQVVARSFPAGGADIRPARLVTIGTRDGKVLHDVRLRLPLSDPASGCGTSQWLSASEVLLRCGTGNPFDETTFRVDTRTGDHTKVAELHPPRPRLFELVRAEN